jgi:DNA-binding protein HU-beta
VSQLNKKEENCMNKSDLVANIAEKAGLPKKDAEKALNAIMDSVEEALVNGDKVQLVGFGSFEVRERSERKGRNPQTKEEITIKASKAPVFKPGKALKDALNK